MTHTQIPCHPHLRRVLLLLLLLTTASTLRAQVITPGTLDYDYIRILQLRQDSVMLLYNHIDMIRYRRPARIQHDLWNMYASDFTLTDRLQLEPIFPLNLGRRKLPDPHPAAITWELLPVRTATTWNSGYAHSRNNGPLWHGRGLTQEVHAGGRFRYGPLFITLQPVVFYSQNRSFELLENPVFQINFEKSPLNYPLLERIDWVQRYGESPFLKWHPGQSDISLMHRNIRVGASTQNMIMGQSWQNPITMSANAPGYPHLYFATDEPVWLWIGNGEFKFTWARPYESNYFDTDASNDHRYMTTLSAGWMPRYTKGLVLSFNRVMFKRSRDFEWGIRDILATFHNFNAPIRIDPETGIEFNDDILQVTSISGRWSFSEVGFEPFFEFARNDFGGGPFGPNPEHSRAYSFGFTKLFNLPDASVLALTGELANTGYTRTFVTRGPGSYYGHTFVDQGYTNDGQIIGSHMGPGGFGYNIFLRRYSPRGMHGVVIDYMRRHDDFYFLYFDNPDRHDYEYTFGYRGVVRFPRLDVGLTALFTWRNHMNMVQNNNVQQTQLAVSLKYQL